MDLEQKKDNPIKDDVYFKHYKPVEKDLITSPKYVMYRCWL